MANVPRGSGTESGTARVDRLLSFVWRSAKTGCNVGRTIQVCKLNSRWTSHSFITCNLLNSSLPAPPFSNCSLSTGIWTVAQKRNPIFRKWELAFAPSLTTWTWLTVSWVVCSDLAPDKRSSRHRSFDTPTYTLLPYWTWFTILSVICFERRQCWWV